MMSISTVPTVLKWATTAHHDWYDLAPVEETGGWFDGRKHTYEDYINAQSEKARPYVKALSAALWLFGPRKFYAFGVRRELAPVFSDHTIAFLTPRAWGDLLAATFTKAAAPLSYKDFLPEN